MTVRTLRGAEISQFQGPLFLVGMPRSGTKLLRGLLNEHPQIAIPLNETTFLPDWRRRWAGWGDLSRSENFQRFYEDVSGSMYFVHRLEEHGQRTGAAEWHAACESYDLPGVFEALIRLDAGAGPGDVWGDKSPNYLDHMPLLKELFPQARFIHIVRDARDYCLSMRQAFGKSMLRAAQRWRDQIVAARAAAAGWAGDYAEVRYEDLLADPEPELQRLCGFLGVEYTPRMLALRRAPENLGDAKGERSIKRDNAEKWRSAMAAEDRRVIERISGDALRSLGYPVEFEGVCRVSRAHMLLLQAYDGWQLTRREAQKRGWPDAIRFRLRLFQETGRAGA